MTIQNPVLPLEIAPSPVFLANRGIPARVSAIVSAIVSAYFCEPYLKGRIENLLLQDCEIVVICQKDSREMDIALSFPDINIVLTPDVPTVYEAWNMGIQNSHGKYITSANSDDRHYPGSLKTLCAALDEHPRYSLAYSDIDRVINVDGPPDGKFVFMRGGLQELFMQGCFLGPMPVWRRSLHDEYGYFNEEYTVAGDYEFWMLLASKGEQFFKIDQTLGSHLERDEALEHKSPVKTAWEIARAKSKFRGLIEKR